MIRKVYKVVYVVGIAIVILLVFLRTHVESRSGLSLTKVDFDKQSSDDFIVVTLINMSNGTTRFLLNPNVLDGKICILTSDQQYKYFVTKEYWHLLATASSSSNIRALKFGEIMRWEVRLTNLVDMEGKALTIKKQDIYRMFCELDAVSEDSAGKFNNKPTVVIE